MATVTTTLQGVPVWTEHGPGAIVDSNGGFLGTGAIVAVAVDPTDSGTIYAATSGGGVWRSRDARPGNPSPSWAPVTDAHPSPAMGAIAISPLDRQTVYAGTGSFASFGPSGTAVGLYRSTDGGDSWRNLAANLFAGIPVRDLLPTRVSERAGQVVLAAVLSNSGAGTTGGIFRSEDGGQSFVLQSGMAETGLPSGDGWALAEDPTLPGHVYAAVGGATPGIYYSGDGGKTTWTEVTSGMDPTVLAAAQWIRLAVAPDPTGRAGTLCVGIINGGQPVRTYRTPAASGREQWTCIGLPPGGPDAIEPLKQALWKFALAIDPQSGDMYVGGDEGGGVWRCGLADPSHPVWEKISKSLDFAGSDLAQDPDKVPHADIQDLVFDRDGNLLAACDGGIYRMPNPGNRHGGPARKWTAIGKAIRNNEAFSVALDSLNNLLTVASADNGTSVQERQGSGQWTSTLWGDGAVQAVNNDAPRVSWRYSEDGDLSAFSRWKVDSRNNAAGEPVLLASRATPTVVGSGLNSIDRAPVMNPDGTPALNSDGSQQYQFRSGTYVLNNLPDSTSLAGKPSRMMVGSNGLYESQDGGSTINEITVTDPSTNAAVTDVHSIAYGAREDGVARPDVAYVGMGAGLWLRGPRGGAFTPVTSYPGGSVTHVAVDPDDWKRAYVVDESHVYRTDSGGQTWEDCTGNLQRMTADPTVYASGVIVVRSGEAEEAVFVGAVGGIYRCLNPADGPGAVWTKFGRNLPGGCFGQDIHYYPNQLRNSVQTGDELVASIYGRGVWTLPRASGVLFEPSVLRITGTAREQYVRLVRNPDVPGQLDVHAPDGAGPTLSLPLACVGQILVDCVDGSNTLTLDCTNGTIDVPLGIEYTAGGSDNRLVLKSGRVEEQVFDLTGGSTGSASIGGMRVRFSSVAQIDDSVLSGLTVVEDVPPPDGLRLSNGSQLDGLPTLGILHQRGAAQVRLNLANSSEVRLDVTRGAGGVVVEDLFGTPARMRRLLVVTGRSGHEVRIATSPPGVDLEVRGAGGQDTIFIGTVTGTGGLLQAVRGPIRLSNTAARSVLNVSDATGQVATTATLTDRSLTGLAPAPITFGPNTLNALTVAGSRGGTTFTVESTGPYPVALLGIGAVNRLDVHATSGLLDYTSGSGVDNVHIGAPASGGAQVANVTGNVRLHCTQTGNLNVTIDDSGDGQQRDVVITDHSISGLAPAEIDLFPGANPFLNGVTVLGGRARMFYSVVDTPPMFAVTLHGQGQDVVDVYRTRLGLAIDGAAGVTIGGAPLGLGSVLGAVTIGGGASTAVVVDDSATGGARSFSMSAGEIDGLTRSPISFTEARLHSLVVRCGSGGNRIVVAATVAGGATELDLGAGPDLVNVQATSGPLAIAGRAGALDELLIGSTSEVLKDDLDGITGEIRIIGRSDAVHLVVSDVAGKQPRRAGMEAGVINGLAPAVIGFAPLAALDVHLSHLANAIEVSGTNPGGPVVVHTGGGDAIEVKTSQHSPCNLLVDGPAVTEDDGLRVILGDPARAVTHTQPVGTTPGEVQVTFPDGSTSTIQYRHMRSVQGP